MKDISRPFEILQIQNKSKTKHEHIYKKVALAKLTRKSSLYHLGQMLQVPEIHNCVPTMRRE